ncbi:MAG: hypothetical protein JNM27_22555 [Leptospirales bacterium]|nr:hypothetical protein [Leptospirales bacterium]
MQELIVKPLSSDFKIRWVVQGDTVSKSIQAEIDSIWQKEKTKRGDSIFDGKLLAFAGLTESEMQVRTVTYSSFLAQIRKPELYEELRIESLAVSGLVYSGSSLAFGKRSAQVTASPGEWELIPSGSITPTCIGSDGLVRMEEQFFEELEEELGVSRARVMHWQPFLFVHDPEIHTIDIGIEAELSTGDKPSKSPQLNEYSEIRWIETTEIDQFCRKLSANEPMHNVSRALLQAKSLAEIPGK